MRRFFDRAAALALALVLALAACPAALADITDKDNVVISLSDTGSVAGYARFQANIENNGDNDIKLTGISGYITNNSTEKNDYSTSEYTLAARNSTAWGFTLPVDNSVSGNLRFYATFSFVRLTSAGAVEANSSFSVSTSEALNFEETTLDTNLTEDTTKPAVKLSAFDKDKNIVPTPSGNAGDAIAVRIPLLITATKVSNLSIVPTLSTNLDEFPFEIEKLDYTLNYDGTARSGQKIEFQYQMKLSPNVTSGVKKVSYTVSYAREWGGTLETTTVDIYINVIKGYVAPSTDQPTTTVSEPKLILDGYTFSADKIYAGEQFDVTFTLRNTSSAEAVQNIQISVSDDSEAGKLMPANGGSNTLFIAKIGTNETSTVTISMQSAADTDPKAYKLTLGLAYEGAKNVAKYTATETLSLTILQKIRLKFDEPQFYDEFYVGGSTAAFLAMYNLGKSSIYNCAVDVEGEGLSLESTCFIGTVAGGGTMNADFTVIAETPGEINGEIVVTYEDSLMEQMEERIPFTINVTDLSSADESYDPTTDPGYVDVMENQSTGFPLWAWIAIGAAVVAGAVILIVVLKKRRAKELEDV